MIIDLCAGKSWGQQGFISIREGISFFEELVYVGLLVLEELVFTLGKL